MNRSQISNSFNFQNQLELSRTKKDRTQGYETKEFYGFQDFMNIDDKTFKSQKASGKQHNTSDILKKEDSNILPNNLQDFNTNTQQSIKPKSKGDKSITQHFYDVHSPKFASHGKNISNIFKEQDESKKQFTLRRNNTVKKTISTETMVKSEEPNFKKKVKINDVIVNTKEEEYKDLNHKIKFYQDQIDRVTYQSTKIQQETEELLFRFETQKPEVEVIECTRQIEEINSEIENQRNLQAQLLKMLNQLETQYEEVGNSIKSMNFKRPTIIRDQSKAIIDDINALKAQFEILQRDSGSLNLSSTLINPTGQFIPPLSSNKINLSLQNDIIQEIYKQSRICDDPRYLYNLKMACLRDDWIIFTNSQIQINTSYRNCPKIQIKIGNKGIKDLQKFNLKQNGELKLEGQIISAKSFIILQIQSTIQNIHSLFFKCQISYGKDKEKRQVTIFIPSGMSNFGLFAPMTDKQFKMESASQGEEFSGSYKPIDKKMVQDVSQCAIYLPNLIYNEHESQCYGLYVSPFNEYVLLFLKQKAEMIAISVKNQNQHIIRLFQFIFTV